MTKSFHSVSDHRYLDKLIGTANRNRSHEVYRSGKQKREQEIDLAYELVEGELSRELTEADVQADVYGILYAELTYVINQHDLDIEPEDVIPHFWKVYGLKEIEK